MTTSHLPLLAQLKARFDQHMQRHADVPWGTVLARLNNHPQALRSLQAMEESGGEPDVLAHDTSSGQVWWCDCAAESPVGRRSLCYDDDALAARKENRPQGSAQAAAAAMGAQLLTEAQYRHLQTRGVFDTKTSSWLQTPDEVRALGGALFGDRRYNQVFVYHNGVQSYYAARGFRLGLWV